MSQRVSVRLRREIRERAKQRCEYCLIHEREATFAHEPDHVISRRHGGETTSLNLAWSCFDGNRLKGSDLSSIDLETGRVVRLFPDYRAEEARFFKKTGIFPIMHLIAIRRTVLEQHPWIAMNLFKMFEEAKRRCFNRLRDFTCARIPLPWAAAIAEEIAGGFGPDPYPYGIEESRPTIEAFCRYAHDQGVTHRRMGVDDLFPREVRAMARV